MARVWKDILYPGVWTLRNGRRFVCRPAELAHYADRMRQQLRVEPVPVVWEHQKAIALGSDYRQTMSREDVVRQTVSHVADVRVNGNALEVGFDVTDPADLKQLAKVKFVSPYINWNITTSDGTTWEGPSVVHVAVTPKPVQYPQKPFDLSGRLVGATKDAPVALSQWAYQEPVCLSHATYTPLSPGGSAMADKDDDLDKPGDDEDMPPAAQTPPVPEAKPVDTGSPGLGDDVQVKQVLPILARLGLVVPDDTNATNFLERVTAAALTMEHHVNKAGQDDAAEAQPAGGPEATTETAPVMMSQLEDEKRRTAALKEKLTATQREALLGRATGLFRTGRIDRRTFLDLEADLKSVALSVTDAGELESSKALTQIEAYEKLPAGRTLPVAGKRTEVGPEDEAALELSQPDSVGSDEAIIKGILHNWGMARN